MKRIIHLEPSLNEKQKTFGNKAIVEIEIDNETNKFKYTLYSYGTKICSIKNNVITKYWDNYSKTTMKHINSFLEFCGLERQSKKWWLNLQTEKDD